MNPNDKPTPQTEQKQQTVLGKIKDAVLPKSKQDGRVKVKALIQVQMPKQLYHTGDIFEVEEQATLDYLINSKAVVKIEEE